jgi:hypothetical protein
LLTREIESANVVHGKSPSGVFWSGIDLIYLKSDLPF